VKLFIKQCGFSLVEVVLALGIVAVGLIGVISVISYSLQSDSASRDDTALGLMTQTTITELHAIGYSMVIGTGSGAPKYTDADPDYFFAASGALCRDAMGAPITNATAASANLPVYCCTVTIKNSPQQPSGMVYLRLDFSWPIAAPTAKRQHKMVFTSLAKYDDF